MNATHLNGSQQSLVQRISALNVEPIMVKLMDSKEGQGWNLETARKVETEYKRFLELVGRYGAAVVAPSKSVQVFWEQHVLDTQKYAVDSEQVFGDFLHHQPLGRDAETPGSRLDRTLELYSRTFRADSDGYLLAGAATGSRLGHNEAWCFLQPEPNPNPCEGVPSCYGDIRSIDSLDIRPALAALNLENVRRNFMEKTGFSPEQVDIVEGEYKCFLELSKTFPHAPIVPSQVVDEFWHEHILETRQYAEDTTRVLGTFLHHFPYFGLRGPEDAENLHQSFATTLQMYEDTFGREPTRYLGVGVFPPPCSDPEREKLKGTSSDCYTSCEAKQNGIAPLHLEERLTIVDDASAHCDRGCSPQACVPGGCNPGEIEYSMQQARPTLQSISEEGN